MEAFIQNEIENITDNEAAAAKTASTEVLRQYEEDPSISGNLVMMAFN